MEAIKQTYVAKFPQSTKDDDASLEDPANDPNFNEPIIDRLRMQREEVNLFTSLGTKKKNIN